MRATINELACSLMEENVVIDPDLGEGISK